jgi:hypothetical protein
MSTAPMSGTDTRAAYKGLIIGFAFVAVVVVSIVILTNKKFEAHEATPAATTH